MTKKFTINCDFGGQLSPFAIYIGRPQKGHHPLHFQADWLSKSRGGMIPGEVMDAVTQLQELAEKNGVALEDLCVYALGTDKQQAELEGKSTEDLQENDSEEEQKDENLEGEEQESEEQESIEENDEGDEESEGGGEEEGKGEDKN